MFNKSEIISEFKSRDYQLRVDKELSLGLKKKKNNLLVAIMGSGKTVMTVRLINKYYKKSNKKFIILAHKKELVSQFKDAFRTKSEVRNKDVGICCTGLESQINIHERVTIGTIQSFINFKEKYRGKCDLLIIDEVHRALFNGKSQYSKVYDFLFKKNKKMRFLGLTATPFRLGQGYIYGKKCLNRDHNKFTSITSKVSYKELVEKKFLTKLKGKIATSKGLKKDLDEVGKGVSGDFLTESLSVVMGKEQHLKNILKAYQKIAYNRKCICVLCVDIKHAEKAFKLFDTANVSVTIVHSGLTKIERAINMRLWETGKKQVMISVNLLLEGYDLPKMDTIINARPTKSPVLFFQSLGRPLRLFKGKEYALYIDLTPNTKNFRLDLDNIKVSIPIEKPKKIKIDEKTEKICPECGGTFHKSLKKCYECGFTFAADKIREYESDFPVLKDVEFTGNNDENYDEVETLKVGYMFFNVNESVKSKKKQGVIVFGFIRGEFTGIREEIKVYFCLKDYYSGYAVQKAEETWSEFNFGIPLPKSIDEWEDLVYKEEDSLVKKCPDEIYIDFSLDFPSVVGYNFNKDEDEIKTILMEDDIPF